jgi:hypothetical protein
MSVLLFANNAITALAQPLSATATTCTVAPSTGDLFPVVTPNTSFFMTFTDVATETINEIVLVTARAGDVMTIVRGQDDTTAKAWNAGDLASMLPTAETMRRFIQFEENSGITIQNDVGTPSLVYPLLAQQTSGDTKTLFTSNPKYQYNPSNGQLKAETMYANNGLFVNKQTISTSYIIATGDSAMTTGPSILAPSVVVTVSAGSRFVVL